MDTENETIISNTHEGSINDNNSSSIKVESAKSVVGEAAAATAASSSSKQTPNMSELVPREDIIKTAVSFLQNPNVKRSPLNQKQKFLQSKGLTDDEIQIACERAGVFNVDTTNYNHNNVNNMKNNQQQQLVKLSTFQKIREFLHSVAVFAGIGYAIYLFYKRFIEPLIFRKKKKKSVEETLDDMDRKVEKNIKDLNVELGKIREEITNTSRDYSLSRDIQNFKVDLDAIKGLLLNRQQFSGPMVPPSIPAWQLQSQMTQVGGDTDLGEADKNDDAGSGSSETEVVTKNSDSSIEMM